jgi:hypothetical protein
MKPFVLAALALLLAIPSRAADPETGDPRAQVIRLLGKPKGRASAGELETLAYDRGVVELTTGHVTRVRLVTAELLAQRIAAQEAAARANAERQRERIAAGEKARDELLQNDAYTTNSPAEKVAAWEQFRQAHPDVSPPAEFQQAVSAKAEEERKAQAAAALAAAKEKDKPRLSSSKRRKMGRRLSEDSEATSDTP